MISPLGPVPTLGNYGDHLVAFKPKFSSYRTIRKTRGLQADYFHDIRRNSSEVLVSAWAAPIAEDSGLVQFIAGSARIFQVFKAIVRRVAINMVYLSGIGPTEGGDHQSMNLLSLWNSVLAKGQMSVASPIIMDRDNTRFGPLSSVANASYTAKIGRFVNSLISGNFAPPLYGIDWFHGVTYVR